MLLRADALELRRSSSTRVLACDAVRSRLSCRRIHAAVDAARLTPILAALPPTGHVACRRTAADRLVRAAGLDACLARHRTLPAA